MSSEVWVCPECGAKCEVKDMKTGARESSTLSLVSAIEVFKGVQVVRTFEASRCNYNDGGKTLYSMTELYQIWMLENGREIITTIGYDRSYNYFHWHFGAPYSIGRHSCGGGGYYYYEDVYNVNDNFIYPRLNISPFFRMKGIDRDMVRWLVRKSINIPDAFCSLAKDARMETLLKTGYQALFARFVKADISLGKYWKSINICHRHGYAIDDAILWCDHIEMLEELGMDIHNPKYICPEDLRKQHDQMSRRLEMIQGDEGEVLRSPLPWRAHHDSSHQVGQGNGCRGTGAASLRVLDEVLRESGQPAAVSKEQRHARASGDDRAGPEVFPDIAEPWTLQPGQPFPQRDTVSDGEQHSGG